MIVTSIKGQEQHWQNLVITTPGSNFQVLEVKEQGRYTVIKTCFTTENRVQNRFYIMKSPGKNIALENISHTMGSRFHVLQFSCQ